MQFPSHFIGTSGNVTRQARKVARKLIAGTALSAIDLELVSDFAGYVSVDDPVSLRGDHFYGFKLIHVLTSGKTYVHVEDARWHAWLSQLLAAPWGMLCIIGQHSQFIVAGEEQAREYVQAMDRHWEILTSLGARYYSAGPKMIWNAAPVLYVALAKLGATQDQLNRAYEDAGTKGDRMRSLLREFA